MRMLRVMLQIMITHAAAAATAAAAAAGDARGRPVDGDDGGAAEDGAHGDDGDGDGTDGHGAHDDACVKHHPYATMRTMLMTDMVSRRGHPSLKKT